MKKDGNNMKRIIVGLILLLPIGTIISGCAEKSNENNTGEIEALSLGAPPIINSTLIYVADENNFFAQNNLDIKIKQYSAGRFALEDVMKGKIDIAAVTEFAFVGRSFDNPSLRILAVIAESYIVELVARKDRGISNPADLNGKKIGVTKLTEAEFFLGSFLIFNSLAVMDVEIVDLKPTEIASAISTGKVDAIISWEPIVSDAINRLGDNAISWPAQSGQESNWLLVTREDVIRSKPSALKHMLNALIKSEDYVSSNPDETKDILSKRLALKNTHLEELWSKLKLSVSLPQKLLLAMEDGARWKIQHNMTDGKSVPNYLNFLYVDALEEVKPEAVTIIR